MFGSTFKELSMKLQYKSNNSYESDQFTSYLKSYWPCNVVVGAVKGLIFINPYDLKVPIAICNPFLGQLKILPSSSSPSCEIVLRKVAIGFDKDEDYKVVQLQHCRSHECLHAQLYSRRTDSWRELEGDNRILDDIYVWIKPIKSRYKNGYFSHWSLHDYMTGADILSLDMKNEVFRRIRSRPNFFASSIFAKDEDSFQGFEFKKNGVNIHELICEGSELSWNYTMAGKVRTSNSEVPLWSNDCVIFEDVLGTFVYDQRAHTQS
ncbi:hypothetical protein SASPL_147909 [Salvia splendens]|uniref:F-box associated beta-propeller type 3 domain-containing protein n=1 Tax=Salvia splendens TaxID=180675 RepID=A0A8X8WFZ8_SALSN|nr:hypothetical protein SASPL_147909 [Salvia splendens]